MVYTGERPWDGPMSLHEMLDRGDEIRAIVPDYPMFLIDLGHDKGYNFKNEKLRELSEILNAIYSGEDTDREVTREMLALAGILANDSKLYEAVNEKIGEGETLNMCNILAERDRKSEAMGIAIGEARGIAMLIIRKLNKVGAVDEKLQKKIMEVSDEEVLIKWFDDVDSCSLFQEFVMGM